MKMLPLMLLLAVAFTRGEDAETATALTGRVAFDQHLQRSLPLTATFRDEAGRPVQLGRLLNGQPAVVALVYFGCPNLCTIVLNGLLAGLRDLHSAPGRDFQVIIVSIDPRETATLAAEKKANLLRHYGRSGTQNGWHVLTGDEPAIHQLADAIGFRYFYDEKIQQFAHPSGITLVTPSGQISQYLLGIEFPAEKLAAAFARAKQGRIGMLAQNLLLLCFHYDPLTGRYSLLITRVLQAGGMGSVLALGGLVFHLHRARRRSFPA